jgi:hypothetical protein
MNKVCAKDEAGKKWCTFSVTSWAIAAGLRAAAVSAAAAATLRKRVFIFVSGYKTF